MSLVYMLYADRLMEFCLGGDRNLGLLLFMGLLFITLDTEMTVFKKFIYHWIMFYGDVKAVP